MHTHETVSFALASRVYLFRALPTVVCLLADGGPARLRLLIEYDSPPDAGHSRLFGLSGCLMVSPLSWVFHMTAKEMSVVTRPKGLHRSISEGKSRWLYIDLIRAKDSLLSERSLMLHTREELEVRYDVASIFPTYTAIDAKNFS